MFSLKNINVYFLAIKTHSKKFIKDIFFKSDLYNSKIIEKRENKFLFFPNPYLLSSLTNKNNFEFDVSSETIEKIWSRKNTEDSHSFLWLSLIDRKNDGVAVRKIINEWILRYKDYDSEIWKPSLTSLRVISWIMNAELILNNKNVLFKNEFVQIIFKQINHLKKNYLYDNDSSKQIEILSAIIISGIVFKERNDNFDLGLNRLEKLLLGFFDDKGFPYNKNPHHSLKYLKYVVIIKECLKDAHKEVPKFIDEFIETSLNTVLYLTTPNKNLPLFNGATETNLNKFFEYLKNLNYKTKEPKDLVIDIKKIKFKKDSFFFDACSAPKKKFSEFYQSGPLSFEYFYDKDKIITNSGFGSKISKKATLISRLASSQSSITINDFSTTRLEKNNLINKAFGFLIKDTFSTYDVKVFNDALNIGLCASHDAYKNNFGVKISRSIKINKQNSDLEGEDTFLRPNTSSKKISFIIRFHLYPGVNAVKTLSGKSVLIQISKNKSLIFSCDNCTTEIEKGLFLGKNKIINNLNIFLKGDILEKEKTINWKIKKKINAEEN